MGLLLAAALGGCGGPAPAGNDAAPAAAANSVAAAPAQGTPAAAASAAAPSSGRMMPFGEGGAARDKQPAAAGSPDRSGPTRRARCQINDEPEQPCAFTPVFGDGSFDIEMPDRQLRLIVEGEEAAPFELIGERRIPIPGILDRDPADRACWVSGDPDATLARVCAR